MLFHSKTWLVMKLTIVLLIAACLQVQANGYAQRISISEHNASLEKVLQKIKRQSKLHMVYREEWLDIAGKVTLSLKDVTIEEALEASFKNQPLTYELIGRTIVVKKRERYTPPLPPAVAEAPAIVIAGRVTGSDGTPLGNVSVILKGTTTGATTDVNGSFSINVPNEKAVLVFSSVGFQAREIVVGNKKNLEIVLLPAVSELEDVVVVAYGTQKKVSVTGAVSSVNSDELRQSSSASLANALAGRLSGLTSIQSGGGQPGRDDATMYLRGAATTNGQGPLILIDGVPRDKSRT